MKKNFQILILASLGLLLQNCATNDVDNDFSAESLSNESFSWDIFRNRKYEYAKVQVKEEPSLIIPTGLNGEKIKPALKLPDGDDKYARSQVPKAYQQMLPPNYTVKFDMAKIISDQISKVSISVVYDDSGSLKLVFREPLSITINLLDDYFKGLPSIYTITSEKDEVLSGHLITIKDSQKNLIFVIKARKIDELSSLVKINAVFTGDGETQAPDHISEGVRLLSEIRKELNNTELKSDDNLKIAKQAEAEMAVSDANSSKGQSSLGGLLGSAKKSKFGFGSYDRTIDKSIQQDETDQIQNQMKDYTKITAPSGDSVFDSQTQAQELNI
ncbi:hypothetical protein IBE48_06545 [Francisella philomiragia]|uniref:Lipoprotein n=1 Tax=Francisella philomiragia TaxID=28110 RepID=A0AAW3DE47_9GAMM|nr:hypothetical protein [Francisella philomiragia]AJI75280.1 hypothetical protein BZ13_1695 [Francisella philomiragia subsp. philomiragia ATCC 25015]EET20132.1 conserved hypothetical protein [Francisella philomiragia subsp. philomiragia ATCC 25015]KFJ44040.1 hypothetical protein DR78_1346 [Francisella philomiragia]MBK2094474.1 hypothetical protein [Francisella philomiragia]MBK2107169.1 hypothetical protein [Francisella philomiragia]